ncbi:MAG: methyltransferase domain-containing protein [Desulfopila sp.]|jgi:hypothetical protein|nr:methyltransferase domain-containing protein [Desulfopila sp.]
MNALSQNTLAKLILTAEYGSLDCYHIDHYFADNVNLWRDCFTPPQIEALEGVRPGERVMLEKDFQVAAVPYAQREIHRKQWQPPADITPRRGRYYPQSFVRGVSNIYSQSSAPLRIEKVTADTLAIDTSHPLAEKPLTLWAEVAEAQPKAKERGGRCSDWIHDMLAGGPGMQCRRDQHGPDFNETNGMMRIDETEDPLFYAAPRMVHHIDSQARAHLTAAVADLIHPDMKVLDLMSSAHSHLPPGMKAVGLGLNEKELAANPALSSRTVQDLNSNPVLPYESGSFDAVTCHLSIEYLLAPAQNFHEVSRVLQPGGIFFVSFSNRWFPPKVIRLWQQLHEWERMAYVISLLVPEFTSLQTTSFRNWPRPEDDPHADMVTQSDPLYIVSACRKGSR